ncbi:hypothetical protein SDC9_94156 [bioreactor metagenome]|uniref:Uncharacterized protein n=1 Tax=bioreactor metagenome TaxID=1076179 RepID=A0A645A3D1_9ZZZZ
MPVAASRINRVSKHTVYAIRVKAEVETFLLLMYFPHNVKAAIRTADIRASTFPNIEPAVFAIPERAVSILPHTVIAIASMPFLGIVPCIIMQKPTDANITSVSTSTVEHAIVVCLRDSNQKVK